MQASLEPTAQIVFLARSAGFSNVHDYLVGGQGGVGGRVCVEGRGAGDAQGWLCMQGVATTRAARGAAGCRRAAVLRRCVAHDPRTGAGARRSM